MFNFNFLERFHQTSQPSNNGHPNKFEKDAPQTDFLRAETVGIDLIVGETFLIGPDSIALHNLIKPFLSPERFNDFFMERPRRGPLDRRKGTALEWRATTFLLRAHLVY